LVKQLHFFALIVSTQLLNDLLITLSTQIASPEKELRATPSDGVNFIPYMKLLGVE
jgi:hypothetical protein